MKKLVYLLFISNVLLGCKQETKANGIIQNQNNTQIKNDSEEAVKFLKEFYFSVYGSDSNNEALKKKYVSERILKKIDNLSSDGENLVLDYDPFIKAQDFDGNVIKKTLEIIPLKNENEYRASFLLFGNKDEKRTDVDFLLKKNKNGAFMIDSILNDEHLSFAENSDVKQGEFYVLDSANIKTQRFTFNVSILEKNENKNKENVQHNSNPVLIYRGDKNYENNNLIHLFNDNCSADGFQKIVSKSIFFTIEQSYCKDFLFVSSYTTFKIDEKTGEIYLNKYGEGYTDRSNPDKNIPSKTWTSKDFGNIKFENVTNDFLFKLK